MKKIALISAINMNYGTLLQAYALQKCLEELGLENDIFYYISNPVRQFYRVFNFQFLITKLKALNIKRVTRLKYPEIYKQILIREQAFLEFKKRELKFTPQIHSKNELKELVKKYDGVILGSDQVWNPQNLGMDYYTLNFVPEQIPKITYAPSFGVEKIPWFQRKRTKKYLKRIDYISVREMAGSKIIENLIGSSVPVVCDPTALLPREKWERIRSKKHPVKGDYIFCYFLGSNMQYRKFAKIAAGILNCKIVAFQHMDEFVEGDIFFADEKLYKADPADFIELIAESKLVLTDSFHGTMFSVYYHKDFFTFNYDKEGSRNSVNSRIDSIMNILPISDRRLSGSEEVSECLKRKIEWDPIQAELENFREYSMQYLINALEDVGLL